MGAYFDEMKRTMSWLAEQPNTLFLGQAVGVAGTFLHGTIEQVPIVKRLEMPVCEAFQMQITAGLGLAGIVPISIYPRQNFLMLALGEMSNVIDKLGAMSDGRVHLPVIIRTAAGTTKPIHPGHQHIGNFAEAFRRIFSEIAVKELHEPQEIFPAYQAAYSSGKPHLLIEFGDSYNDK